MSGGTDVLSSKTLYWLKVGINIPDFFGIIPYSWDNKTGRVVFNNSWKRHLAWSIHNFFYCGYLAFVVVRWIQYAFYREYPTSPRALGTFYIMTCYWINMGGQYSLLKFYGEHHIFINNFLDFLKNLQKSQLHSPIKLHDGSKVCRNFCRLVLLVFSLDTYSCFAIPDAPFFISSLLPDPNSLNMLQRFPLVSFHMYIWLLQWTAMYFHICSIVPYLAGLKNSLLILTHGTLAGTEGLENAPPLSKEVVERTTTFAVHFRQMEVLNCHGNQLWSTGNAILEISMLFGIICACYGTVRLDASRAGHQASIVVLLTGTVIVIWGIMGELFEISKNSLESWRKMKRNAWFRRFHVSCQPVRVNIGQGLFFADKGIRLTLLEIISTNVSSLLLSTSKKNK